jgi:Cu-processing system permease protein
VSRSKTGRIALYQVQDLVRSRWVLLYAGFFLVMTDALFRFGGGGERVMLSLMNVVLIAIPLVSLVLGAMYLYGSREFVELLLSQPIRRRSLFAGLVLGLVVPMTGAFVIGAGLPFLYHGGVAEAGAGSVALLLVTGVALTVAFTGVAFLVALSTEDRLRGLGLCLAIWLFFAVLFDGLVLLAIHLLAAWPVEHMVIGTSMLNPVSLGRTLLMLNLDFSALMGFTGAVFLRFFGSGLGQAVTATALVVWLAGPMALGMRAFVRKNF